MALSEENGGMSTTMLVGPAGAGPYPMYMNGGGNNSGFDNGNGWWIILLFILLAGGNWGNNNGSGFGGQPVVVNDGNNCQRGFDQAAIMNGINDIQGGVQGLSTQLCNGFSQAEISANSRQMANMSQAFAAQTAMAQGFNQLGSQFADCCCENRLGIADLKYTVATENCADRTAAAQNTRDIIDSQTRGTQAILDKLCQLELDGIKGQLAQAQRENVGLQNQINMASFRESQANQNAFISQGFANEVDQLYNRLSSCPVPTTPVYGRTPIFTCPQNMNSGCGCGNGFAN